MGGVEICPLCFFSEKENLMIPPLYLVIPAILGYLIEQW